MYETWAYKKDLYYLNFTDGKFKNEIVVSKINWWSKRLQFWRWYKLKNYNVLCKKDPPPKG